MKKAICQKGKSRKARRKFWDMGEDHELDGGTGLHGGGPGFDGGGGPPPCRITLIHGLMLRMIEEQQPSRIRILQHLLAYAS